ncbi:conserved hypothetical protein [Xanthomonas citri pv. fuscans]|nr:hypothetical protein XcfCFBP6994P_01800 [Xanthomonas citri pv. phaseoli var. fuscans]SOO32769.1 conserved hypothetical protein [Xanthomonas citri pv. fuscans]
MKDARQFLPPRQSVVYAHTRRMLDATACNYTTFAMQVAERYLATTAPDVRQVKLRAGEGLELIKAMENNAQVLRRYMDGTVKTLPADLEDAWVLSLPEPYRTDCEQDLARRRGMLAVPMPSDDGMQVACVATLFQEYGELVSALAPAVADGKFGPEDRQYADEISRKGDDVIGAVIGMKRALRQGIESGATGA